MIKIKKEYLGAFFTAVSEKMPLYLPVKKAGEVNYGMFTPDAEVDLTTLKTVKSPKDFFFPQSETMMKFKKEGKNLEIIDVREEKEQFVLFGVRACDYQSFFVLDNVFLQDPVDTFYQARRNAAVIFTLACGKPEESCFCKVFGIDAAAPQGDVTCYLTDEALYLKANTEKGQNVLSLYNGSEAADEKEVESQQKKTREIIEKLPFSHLDLSAFKEENLKEIFNRNEDWTKMSEACLGCGTCTFVCPTCQCFDIREFKTHQGVIRYRCWDSCMYSDFTQMAAANPRTTQMQRFRQRFMHKLVYYPSQYDGMYSCVGCGRCVNKCPQHLNIVKVIKKIGGNND